jgi:hypothetical protein
MYLIFNGIFFSPLITYVTDKPKHLRKEVAFYDLGLSSSMFSVVSLLKGTIT